MKDFVYVSRNEAKPYRERIIAMTLEVQENVREYFTFQYHFIGSSARNMITYDRKSNVGFDFDVNYVINDFERDFDPEVTYNRIFTEFSKCYKRYGFNKIEKSTRVITLKKVDRKTSKVIHSCDIALVVDYEEDGILYQEYIRFNKKNHKFTWENQPAPYYLEEKVENIKNAGRWNEVLEVYIDKKNKNTNPNKKSRALYAETVNEVYMRL